MFGLYSSFNIFSCKSNITYPCGLVRINLLSSKYFIPSFITLKGNDKFFDKSFIFTSLLYLEIKDKYKYIFK